MAIIKNLATLLTKKELESKKRNFITELSNDLYMILVRKAFCSLKIPSYQILDYTRMVFFIVPRVEEVEIEKDEDFGVN